MAAPRRNAELKQALDQICALIARLARKYSIGTVGLTGSDARRTSMAGEAIELLLVPSKRALPFARALADASGRAVRMRDPQTLPYTHPFHYCVRWLNADRLPMCPFPRGAILTSINGAPASIELAEIPHFEPVAGCVRATPSAPVFVPAPALGSFLI